MKIITHPSVDLDAVASVWAVKEFVPGARDAEVEFRKANWDGSGAGEEDIIVDLDAGGKGIKGNKDEDGTVHSAFAAIVERYASEEDREALSKLVRYVDIKDSTGSVTQHLIPEAGRETRHVLSVASLNTAMNALRRVHNNDDTVIVERMSEIFSGILAIGRSLARAETEADEAEVFDGKVAIMRNKEEDGTMRTLFRRGVRVVIYVDGHSLGLVRHRDVDLRMDHSDIRAVVEEKDELDEWFAHSAGFLFCRGSRKAPAETPSRVNSHDFVDVLLELLS